MSLFPHVLTHISFLISLFPSSLFPHLFTLISFPSFLFPFSLFTHLLPPISFPLSFFPSSLFPLSLFPHLLLLSLLPHLISLLFLVPQLVSPLSLPSSHSIPIPSPSSLLSSPSSLISFHSYPLSLISSHSYPFLFFHHQQYSSVLFVLPLSFLLFCFLSSSFLTSSFPYTLLSTLSSSCLRPFPLAYSISCFFLLFHLLPSFFTGFVFTPYLEPLSLYASLFIYIYFAFHCSSVISYTCFIHSFVCSLPTNDVFSAPSSCSFLSYQPLILSFSLFLFFSLHASNLPFSSPHFFFFPLLLLLRFHLIVSI